MHDKKVGWVFLLGALVVGVARVLANVHYPIDIVEPFCKEDVVGSLLGSLHIRHQ